MSWTTERGRVASLSRSRAADDPELLQARANLKTERAKYALDQLGDYVARVVAEAPPLTPAQRDRITALLSPIGGDAR